MSTFYNAKLISILPDFSFLIHNIGIISAIPVCLHTACRNIVRNLDQDMLKKNIIHRDCVGRPILQMGPPRAGKHKL